jgi:hypothetical protein
VASIEPEALAIDLKALVGYFTAAKAASRQELRKLVPGAGDHDWPEAVLELIAATIETLGKERAAIPFEGRGYKPVTVRRAFNQLFGLAGRNGTQEVRRSETIAILGLSIGVDAWRKPGGPESKFLRVLAVRLSPRPTPSMRMTVEVTKYFDETGRVTRIEELKRLRANRPGITEIRDLFSFPVDSVDSKVFPEARLGCTISDWRRDEDKLRIYFTFPELAVGRWTPMAYAMVFENLPISEAPKFMIHADARDEFFRMQIRSERPIAMAWRYDHIFSEHYIPREPSGGKILDADSPGVYTAEFSDIRPGRVYGIGMCWQ